LKPQHLAILIDRLLLDYVTLRANYPSPTTPQGRAAPKSSREYGHPAQWASDRARAIADCLDGASDALRDHLGHLPPPPRHRAENRVVNHAYATLKARLEDLADYPGTEAFVDEAQDLHRNIRNALGQTPQRAALSLPCPSCFYVPVFRTTYDDRRDVIECHHCGHQIKEMEYGLYARILIDELLQSAEQPDPLDAEASQCDTSASGESLPEAPQT